jgi:hypothetical protein
MLNSVNWMQGLGPDEACSVSVAVLTVSRGDYVEIFTHELILNWTTGFPPKPA